MCMDASSNSSSIVIIFLFRYAAMCDRILVYTIAMPVCNCCLSVAHTCFSLTLYDPGGGGALKAPPPSDFLLSRI